MDNRQSWLNYKEQLNNWNSQGNQPPAQTEEQIQSDKRVKGYITNAVESDDILRKIIGLSLINNGMIDEGLGKIYFLKQLVRGRI